MINPRFVFPPDAEKFYQRVEDLKNERRRQRWYLGWVPDQNHLFYAALFLGMSLFDFMVVIVGRFGSTEAIINIGVWCIYGLHTILEKLKEKYYEQYIDAAHWDLINKRDLK